TLPTLKTPAPERGSRIPPLTLSLVAGAPEEYVSMPLNIKSSHWACLVLDSARKTIYCYNSMDKRSHHNLLEEHRYQITSVHSPLQNDGYNCGLFVCLFFWCRLVNEVGSDYSESGWMRRRWNILRMIVQATMDKDSKDQSN
ncbi:hypothetical protein JG687_00019687, partial [Phytophthora cactorum]